MHPRNAIIMCLVVVFGVSVSGPASLFFFVFFVFFVVAIGWLAWMAYGKPCDASHKGRPWVIEYDEGDGSGGAGGGCAGGGCAGGGCG